MQCPAGRTSLFVVPTASRSLSGERAVTFCDAVSKGPRTRRRTSYLVHVSGHRLHRLDALYVRDSGPSTVSVVAGSTESLSGSLVIPYGEKATVHIVSFLHGLRRPVRPTDNCLVLYPVTRGSTSDMNENYGERVIRGQKYRGSWVRPRPARARIRRPPRAPSGRRCITAVE